MQFRRRTKQAQEPPYGIQSLQPTRNWAEYGSETGSASSGFRKPPPGSSVWGSFKPRDVLNYYYKNVPGGLDEALSAAKRWRAKLDRPDFWGKMDQTFSAISGSPRTIPNNAYRVVFPRPDYSRMNKTMTLFTKFEGNRYHQRQRVARQFDNKFKPAEDSANAWGLITPGDGSGHSVRYPMLVTRALKIDPTWSLGSDTFGYGLSSQLYRPNMSSMLPPQWSPGRFRKKPDTIPFYLGRRRSSPFRPFGLPGRTKGGPAGPWSDYSWLPANYVDAVLAGAKRDYAKNTGKLIRSDEDLRNIFRTPKGFPQIDLKTLFQRVTPEKREMLKKRIMELLKNDRRPRPNPYV